MKIARSHALYLVLSMHLAGIIGLHTPWQEWFMRFTPVHILITTGLLLLIQKQSKTYYLAAGIVALTTFGIELAGVQTGLIFGHYQYGTTLGPKLAGTPLLIGINWVLLSFTIGHLLARTQLSAPLQALLAATLMVGIDVFIEPVAIAYDFWSWEQGIIPTQNYLGWWGVSFLLFLILFRHIDFRPHFLADWIWVAQLGFFLVLNLLLLV